MAHVAKVKLSGVAPMIGHYDRQAERRGYRRDNIDPARTALNYAVCDASRGPLDAQVRHAVRLAMESHERVSGRAVRRDANVMMDWVVTAPADLRPADQKRFFNCVVDFVRARYGAGNVPGGFVHLDEATPHVHVPVVPLAGGRLQASKVVDRADLRTFHKDLGRAVDHALGYHVSIELDEAQQGAKQLSALGQGEYKAAKDEVRRAAEEARRAAQDAEAARVALGAVERARDAAEEEGRAKAEELRAIEQDIGAALAERDEARADVREARDAFARVSGWYDNKAAEFARVRADVRRLEAERDEARADVRGSVAGAALEALWAALVALARMIAERWPLRATDRDQGLAARSSSQRIMLEMPDRGAMEDWESACAQEGVEVITPDDAEAILEMRRAAGRDDEAR